MRVLTFTSLFPNSAKPQFGIFVYQRMAHFAKRAGNSVHVVAPVPYFPSWLPDKQRQYLSQIPRQEQIGDITVYHPRYPLLPGVSMAMHGLLMFLGSFSLVRRLRGTMDFDCIDAHYVYPDGCAAILLGKVFNLPVIITARGSDINLFPAFRSIRPQIRWTLQRASGVIGVSAALKDTMVALGRARETIKVIGNGVDLARFEPIDSKEARNQLGIPMDARVIVSVGALTPVKGFQILIPALARILPRYPKARLYVVGEGNDRNKLQSLIQELGLEEHVFLVGSKPNEELKFWFSAADLSCLVSAREGWPNVVLESLACGTPVLATPIGGIPEILTSQELGVFVEQDQESIASGLEFALNKQWERSAIASYGRRRTWDDVASEVENYLISCMEQTAGAAGKDPRRR
jgi:teichuronic acid biosynthesis glycosyltransferase TuaC